VSTVPVHANGLGVEAFGSNHIGVGDPTVDANLRNGWSGSRTPVTWFGPGVWPVRGPPLRLSERVPLSRVSGVGVGPADLVSMAVSC